MAVRRALVECVVLSVQDSGCGVFYPCCRHCFSRIDLWMDSGRHDEAARCSRCGSSCPRQQVDYRYRLSMTVARDRRIFGMTVFGGCLNALFGIHASGLRRLVEEPDKSVESSLRSALLFKAVEDCFIGRHFIFGIKLTDAENSPPLFGTSPSLGGSSAGGEPVRLVANQMLVPRGAAGQAGHTVVSYYQALLLLRQGGAAAAERPLLPPPPCLRRRPPSSSFNDTTLQPASGALSTSRRRSLNVEKALHPTPPWQQSPGLITSSAEQEEEEESCSTQVRTPPTPYQTTRRCSRRETSPLASNSTPAADKYTLHIRPPQGFTTGHPVHDRATRREPGVPHSFGTREASDAEQTERQPLSDSEAGWEDVVLSESLGLFLCEEQENDLGDRCSVAAPGEMPSSTTPLPPGPPQAGPFRRSPKSANPVDESKPLLTPCGNLDRNNDQPPKERESPSASSVEDEEEATSARTYDCSADLFNSSSLTPTPATRSNADYSRYARGACIPQSSISSVRVHRNTTDAISDDGSLLHAQDRDKTSPDNTVHAGDGSYIADTQPGQNSGTKTATMEDCDHFFCLDFVPPSQSTPLARRAGHAAVVLSNFRPDRADPYTLRSACTPLRTTTTTPTLRRSRAHTHQTDRAERSRPSGVGPKKRGRKSKHLEGSFWRPDRRSKHGVTGQNKTEPNLARDAGVCDADTPRADKPVDFVDTTTATPSKTEPVRRRAANAVCNIPGGRETAADRGGSVGHLAEEDSGEAYDLSRDLFNDSF